MKRLLFSAIGVTLTFVWIIYTAPPIQGKNNPSENDPIKTISKSGSNSVNNLDQRIYKNLEFNKLKNGKSLTVNSDLKAVASTIDKKE